MFTGNQTTCLKIRPGQIGKIVQLAADNQADAAEFIDLLCAIVKIEELNLPLKRNQGYVMKYIMQNYHKVAYVLNKSREDRYKSTVYFISKSSGKLIRTLLLNTRRKLVSHHRMHILMGNEGPKHLSYLMSLVDLLATCAEVSSFVWATKYRTETIMYLLTVHSVVFVRQVRNILFDPRRERTDTSSRCVRPSTHWVISSMC